VTVEQAIQLAYQHHQAGSLAEAEKLYRQILAQQPAHPDALRLLGTLAVQTGHSDAAVDLFRQALRTRPDHAETHNNLGNALEAGGRLDEAISAYRRAIELTPDYAEAHYNLGIALQDAGRVEQAVVSYRQAIRLKPFEAGSHYNLGIALHGLGRLDEAIAAYRQAIRLKPNFAEAHINLGNTAKDADQLDEAVRAYRQAIRLKPDLAEAHNNLGNVLFQMGELDEAISAYRQALRLKPGHPTAHGNLLFASLYHPASEPRSLFQQAREWKLQHAEPLKQFVHPHAIDRDPAWTSASSVEPRLRIGYVSPDFRDHPVGRYLLPVLAAHDHEAYEIFAYSNLPAADEITAKQKACCDAWRDIAGLSDERVAEMIRQDGIDILVDLALHTRDHRLLVFARKPAPVQVTWLGYPGTTGLDTIDHRITDPYLDPPGLDDAHYSERSIRLPNTFWCYDPLTLEPEVNSLPCLEKDFVTFGCLNNFCKVNDAVLSLWAGVLNAVPGSRLLLLAPHGASRRRVLDRLGKDGVAPDRVEFVPKLPRSDYLRAYQRIDIALDTFPYNGHTTSIDAFWMGVPVITLSGKTAVGRAGASQLNNLGLPELIAQSREQFMQIAAKLAKDLPRLTELRRMLRERMQASPLMDGPRMARDLEAIYRRIWRDWRESR